jgi:hypothetical protein
MDQELAAVLERMSQQIEGFRGEISQQIEGLREEMYQRMVGLQEEIRHTRVVMEGLRSDIQLIAEGLMDTRERFVKHEADMERHLEEMKSFIALPYRELNTRLSLLEVRAERQERDAMEVIREKFGKGQA